MDKFLHFDKFEGAGFKYNNSFSNFSLKTITIYVFFNLLETLCFDKFECASFKIMTLIFKNICAIIPK